MNAYDFASYLESCIQVEPVIFKAISKQLRNQADRIADLETTVAFQKLQKISDEEIEKIASLCWGEEFDYLFFANKLLERLTK